GLGHRLDRDRRAAADRHVTDMNLALRGHSLSVERRPRSAAGVRPGTSGRPGQAAGRQVARVRPPGVRSLGSGRRASGRSGQAAGRQVGGPTDGSEPSAEAAPCSRRRRTARAPNVAPASASRTRITITGVGRNEPPDPPPPPLPVFFVAIAASSARLSTSEQLVYCLASGGSVLRASLSCATV